MVQHLSFQYKTRHNAVVLRHVYDVSCHFSCRKSAVCGKHRVFLPEKCWLVERLYIQCVVAFHFFRKNTVNFNRSFCKTAAGFHIRNENEESIPQQLT